MESKQEPIIQVDNDEFHIDKNTLFNKNNKIIRAKYNLNTVENRIYQYILYKTQQLTEMDSFSYIYISYNEIRDCIKNKNQWKVSELENVMFHLANGFIFIEETNIFDKTKEWVRYNLIYKVKHDARNDRFIVGVAPELIHFLQNYFNKENHIYYTPVNLFTFLSLRNSYSQRIYELLRIWSASKNVINYKIDELKELLMIENKYNRYPDFKRRVIQPAIEELNEKANMKIKIKENIEKGRKVSSIDFIVQDNAPRTYETTYKDTAINKKLVDKDEKTPNMEEYFYIPKELRLNNSCVNRFRLDFKDYDFNSHILRNYLFAAEAVALEKDNVSVIGNLQYGYFKQTLQAKLEEHKQHLISSSVNEFGMNELESELLSHY